MRLLDSEQIIKITNQNSELLGFRLVERADDTIGYTIDAVFDYELAGLPVEITFWRDLFSISRYYSRDEVGKIIQAVATAHLNIIRELEKIKSYPLDNSADGV